MRSRLPRIGAGVDRERARDRPGEATPLPGRATVVVRSVAALTDKRTSRQDPFVAPSPKCSTAAFPNNLALIRSLEQDACA